MNKAPFNTFKYLNNFFGDRGEPIFRTWVRDWAVIDDLLYIYWSSIAPFHLHPEHDCNVSWYHWKNLYLEVEDECSFRDSIFNKEKNDER